MMSTSACFIAPLTAYSIIRVSGTDAETFLQGQFSCDLKDVTHKQSRMGTANTPKGRAYAVFRIAKLEDDYLIRLPSELAQNFVARLSKYIVFSKAEIAIDEQWCALGVAGADMAGIIQSHFETLPGEVDGTTSVNHKIIINVPSSTTPRYEIWCNKDGAQSLLKKQASTDTPYTQVDWDWFEINEGIADIYTQTQESFVPQMLNLQYLNAINFKKGCYTGQEIIARMKYLGKLKKETYLLSASPAIEIQPGATVFESGSDKKRGTIIRAVNSVSSDATLALAVLDIESVKSGVEFSLSENKNAPAKLIPLPYKK